MKNGNDKITAAVSKLNTKIDKALKNTTLKGAAKKTSLIKKRSQLLGQLQ